MKNVLCLAIFLSWSLAQGLAQVSINENGSPPDTSAMLEVISTNRGLLLPRHSLAGRNAIAAPAEGLIIYNTDCNDLQYFNGAGWVPLGNTGGLAAPGAITGPESVAGGAAGVAFSVAAMPGATGYHWKVPPGATIASGQGTASIIVTFGWCSGGEVSVRAYNDCNSSASASVKQVKATLSVTHTAGAVAPVTKSVAYGLATGIPGSPNKCWITQNLGADRQSTSLTDTTEASAGWYWQFNRKQGYKHNGVARTPSAVWAGPINEFSDWQSANDPCAILLGPGFRLPTKTEWDGVGQAGGFSGSPSHWSSALKLHEAGGLNYSTGALSGKGTSGSYWSSTQYSSDQGFYLFFPNSSTIYTSFDLKGYGRSIRCLRDYCADTPAAPAQGAHTVSDSGVVWRWEAVPGAIGYKWNTTSDYNSALELGASRQRAETSLMCNHHYTRYVWAYNACGGYTLAPAPLTATTPACPTFVCGTPLTISHVAGDIAPVNKTVTYETVSNIPGEPAKCWIARNLGASRQPFSFDDPSEEASGWYWQFNRRQGYRYLTHREPYRPWVNEITENSGWREDQDPCRLELGQGWRIPTGVEWGNVIYSDYWQNTAWDTLLKIHRGGCFDLPTGTLASRGSAGFFWSSAQFESSVANYLFYPDDSGMAVSYQNKASAYTLRCLRDTCLNLTSAPGAGTHQVTSSQVTWNWSPVPGASGYRWSATDDFADANELGVATTYIESAISCNDSYIRYVWAYNTCGTPSPCQVLTASTTPCPCASFSKTHYAGAVAPVNKTVTYGTVTNIAGEPAKCWITRNLGASNQATAVTDATETAAGWYWQFNRKLGYKNDGNTRTPNTVWITTIDENMNWQIAHDPCAIELGTSWRLPTSTEWLNVDNSNGWTTWSGAFGSPLKLHASGYLNSADGTLTETGISGYFWSNVQGSSTGGKAMFINNSNSYLYSSSLKTFAFPIRCLRDTCPIPTQPTAASHVPGHSSITWKWNAASCASGYKWNTTNNYATAVDVGLATSRTETSLSSVTTYTRYVWSYDAFQNPSAQSTTLTATTTAACVSFSKTHTAGSVAPVTKTVTYGVVTNIAGEPTKCWITRNLGASNQATAVSTSTEAAAGWYWQFNRKQGYKHDGSNRTPNTTWITSIIENSDWQTANDPCNLLLGAPWRLPTYTEWYNVDNTGGWTNWNGPWDSGLKLHAAGYLSNSNGSLYNRGSHGHYWSSTQYSTDTGWTLTFGSSYSNMGNYGKAYGFSVRCLRD